MAACATCGSTILFGGASSGQYRFCNQSCLGQAGLIQVAQQVPADLVAREVERLHGGPCPRCQGQGPVDVHYAYFVYSFVVATSWKSERHVCCRGCARKQQLMAALVSGLAGWWGFPWGLIMTPVQVLRNLGGMVGGGGGLTPTPALSETVRMAIAAQAIDAQRGRPHAA